MQQSIPPIVEARIKRCIAQETARCPEWMLADVCESIREREIANYAFECEVRHESAMLAVAVLLMPELFIEYDVEPVMMCSGRRVG